MGRPVYPSDSRRWFRIESPQLADDTADLTDAEFRAFILILAHANETKAQNRGDFVYVARSRITNLAPNKRGSVATSARVVRELCTKQQWEHTEKDGKISIHVRKWSQIQGFAPAELPQDSGETPGTTTTTTTTTTTNNYGASDEAEAGAMDKSEPEKNKTETPTARAKAVWPKLVAAAASHNKRWSAKPGKAQIAIIAARIKSGTEEADLEKAIHGYVEVNGTEARPGFNPLSFLRAATIFQASKIEGYIEAYTERGSARQSLEDRMADHRKKMDDDEGGNDDPPKGDRGW